MKIIFPPKHRSNLTIPTPPVLHRLLNLASRTPYLKHAAQIHAQLLLNCFIFLPSLFSSLLTLYARCGHLTQSLLLFSIAHHPTKNVVTYTSLITHLSRSADPFRSLELFNRMRRSGVYPNNFTFSAVLPACATTGLALHGEQIHGLISRHGFDSDVFVGSALVNMYAKCRIMRSAHKVFDQMPERNLVSWNSLIVGFLQNGVYGSAVSIFREIVRDQLIMPDQTSFSSVLSACANSRNLEFGRQVQGLVVKSGLISLHYVRNSLMDMLTKCGLFEEATMFFRIIQDKDVVSWNVMLMGYVHGRDFEHACAYFCSMISEGVPPEETSYSTVLHACACLAEFGQGTSVHAHIIKTGFLSNSCVQSSLITMYAKCGSLVDACHVFEDIRNCNVVCCTAMIAAYQQHGCATNAIKLFEEMLQAGIEPDYITFVSIISACAYAGRVQEGRSYFRSMTEVHGMNPGHEHYACMVDLYARAGRLEEAKCFIESMPIRPDVSVWGALLGACASYGNLEIGEDVAKKLFELEPDNPGNYVLLSNIYSRNGKIKEADEIRRLMGVNRVRKEPGCSWIDIKNKTFVFTVHDKSHPRTDEIYDTLRKIEKYVREKGYVAETQSAGNTVNEYKEQSLWYHSERLALAFGLLVLPAGAPIRIKKNLRTCGDCHTVIKSVSEIFDREIIVRDINRFHRFTKGQCSCGDYW